jgi:hypothetical protein
VAYTVLPGAQVKSFIRSLTGLSREMRLRLYTSLLQPLREDGDCFRRHGQRADRDLFWYSVILDGKPPRAFRFLVRDASAVYGVLEVMHAEEVTS